jgi:Reverse transcriptase (RNA-dependent DNA polymerase)
VKSYLTVRSQCVYTNDTFSSFLPVTQGVPQGFTLGPLLFSLFINDISNAILFSNYHIYADYDYEQLYLSGSQENIESVVKHINTDLTSISDWSMRNRLCLNSQKTQSVSIYRRALSFLPPIRIDDTTIPYSTKVE